MTDEIMCPHCGRLNNIQKFCVFCGKRLLSDEQIQAMSQKPEPVCLNCGRPAERGQTVCDCGYEFKDIECPECNAKNTYANRFCSSCGEKLWMRNVYPYKYDESLFETHLFNKKLPAKLRNTSIFKRRKTFLKPTLGDTEFTDKSMKNLRLMQSKADDALCEICSRWRIVSPDYCINCLGILNPDEFTCTKCGREFSGNEKRVEYIKNTKKYGEPAFDLEEFKLALKFSDHYLGSLAPSPGESQFEYRERLKWEFRENMIYKSNIKKAIDIALIPKPVVQPATPPKTVVEPVSPQESGTGGYCDYKCRHYYEEYIDEDGGLVGEATGEVFYLCELGYATGGFCKHYDP